MENPALASVRAKLERAHEHLDAIDATLKLVLDTEPKTRHIATKIDPERHQLLSVIPKAEPIDPSLPLMIGDCIHNLRSTLDHLVYQLAVKKGTSLRFADKTFFPICLREADFNDRPKKLVEPYVSDAAFTEIRKSQPYTAYEVPEEADIWVLHKLDIVDKHRLLIVAGEQFAVTEFTLTFPNHAPWHQVIAEPKWKPMEDGAEVLRFEIPADLYAPGKVHMQMNAIRSVQIINTGLACDGLPVKTVLDQLGGIVAAIVRDFGEKFFGE